MVSRPMSNLEVTEGNTLSHQCTFKFLIRCVASKLERLINDWDQNRGQILYFSLRRKYGTVGKLSESRFQVYREWPNFWYTLRGCWEIKHDFAANFSPVSLLHFFSVCALCRTQRTVSTSSRQISGNQTLQIWTARLTRLKYHAGKMPAEA